MPLTDFGTEDSCVENNGKPHETGGYFSLTPDGEGAYLDTACIHCGRGGCLGKFTKASKVQW